MDRHFPAQIAHRQPVQCDPRVAPKRTSELGEGRLNGFKRMHDRFWKSIQQGMCRLPDVRAYI